MRCKFLLLAMTALVAGSLAGPVAAQTPPAPAYTENGFGPVLLDASASEAKRMQAFAKVIAQANQGQVRAQDLAGTLYWQGPKIPGSPVPVNLDLARKLLANAAIHGDVLAMAKLGELELGAGRLPQAMVWAQMYARYIAPMVPVRGGRNSQYAAGLVKRILDAGGKLDKNAQASVASMVQRFDRSIRDGIDAVHAHQRRGRTYLVRPASGNDSIEVSQMNGVAEFMVGFDTNGRPQRIWPLDAFPDPSLESILRGYLKNVLANSASEGTGMRYLRVSIRHDARKHLFLRPRH